MEILNKSLAFERDLRTANIRELLDKLRPVKTAWLQYIGIGSGAFIVIGLALWGTKELTTDKQPPVVTPTPTQISTPAPSVRTQPQTPDSTPVTTQPTVATPETLSPVSTPEIPPQPTVSTPVPVQQPEPIAATPTPEPPPINNVLSHSATSNDGIVHLQTSKPEYKNGEAFHLSFILTEPRYVRVIDRDAKGEITTLRPNPRQPDKLLPANKQHVFPPNDIDVPVQGIAGNSTVTIIVSTKPFPKNIELLNPDGSIAEQVQSDTYSSWTQAHYRLR